MFQNTHYTVDAAGGVIRFTARKKTLARIARYHLTYGTIHNLRCPITSDDGWLTLDSTHCLAVGQAVEVRNEYQLARANLPIVHTCVIEEVIGNQIKVAPAVPDWPPLRSQQGIFVLRRQQMDITHFTAQEPQRIAENTHIRFTGASEPVTVELEAILQAEHPEVRFHVHRQFHQDLHILNESIVWDRLPPLAEVYRKNRQVDSACFQRRYNVDRQGACFQHPDDPTGVFVYGNTNATSIDVRRTHIEFDLQPLTPFRGVPFSLAAARNNNLLHYASARSQDSHVGFVMTLSAPAEICGLFLVWYRYHPKHLVVECLGSDNTWQQVADLPCGRHNMYPFAQPVHTDKLRLTFTTPPPPDDNLLLHVIDVLVSGENFSLRFNLDDYRDHRYCRYLDPNLRTPDMKDMVMEMRSATRRTRDESATQHFTLHIGWIPPIRPRIMHIPGGAEALLIWTEHADRASLDSHRAVYFGRSDITSPKEAVGGFVHHGIPVTKSVFWSNPTGQPCSTAHNVPQAAVADNQEFMWFCQDLAGLGYEICIHAPHPTNGRPEAGPETARQFANRFGGKTWIDHSARIVHYGLSGQGLNNNSPYCMKDAWLENGFRYFWQFASEDSGEQRVGSINLQQHRLGDWLHTPLFWTHPGETEDFVSWPTLRGGELNVYSDEEIDDLISNWGICINHTYPPAHYDNPSRSQYLDQRDNGLFMASSLLEETLGRFANRIAQGKIKAMTIREVINYWYAINNIEIIYDENSVTLKNHLDYAIQDFTFFFKGMNKAHTSMQHTCKTIGSDILVTIDIAEYSRIIISKNLSEDMAIDMQHENNITMPIETQKAIKNKNSFRDINSNKICCPICSTPIQYFEPAKSNLYDGRPRHCPGCRSSERQRSFVYALVDGKLPFSIQDFNNKSILVISPSAPEKRLFKSIPGLNVTTVDIRPEVKPDIVADICKMPQIKSDKYDFVYASCVLNCVYDLDACLKEIKRVTVENTGIFLSLEILDNDKNTVEFTDIETITKWYGKEVYDKYKVGAYRRFGEKDYKEILEQLFEVKKIKQTDYPTQSVQRWYVCSPKKVDNLSQMFYESNETISQKETIDESIFSKDDHPMIDWERRLIYYWTPRCGSTAFLNWFFQLIGWDKKLSGKSGHQLRELWYKENCYRMEENAESILHDPSWKRFAIMRDPFERTISSYYLVLVNRQWSEIKLKHPYYDDERRLTFNEFLDFLESENLETCNIHWRLQSAKACWLKSSQVPEIIHTANINSRLKQISDEIGKVINLKNYSVTPIYDGALENVNIFNMNRLDFINTLGVDSKSKKLLFPELKNFLSIDVCQRIEKLYKIDLKLYNKNQSNLVT